LLIHQLRYSIIDGQRTKSIGETGKEDPKKLVGRIMQAIPEIEASQWQSGKTKIFMKEQVEIRLEKMRYALLESAVVKIQRISRRFLGRRRRHKIVLQIQYAQRRKSFFFFSCSNFGLVE